MFYLWIASERADLDFAGRDGPVGINLRTVERYFRIEQACKLTTTARYGSLNF